MANDYSGEPSCQALWRFENGALTADSKGGNTLTASSSSPVADTSDYREGAASADFERDSNQYFSIPDAELDAGFPLKSGDANKLISVCAWVKPESSGSWRRVWSKFYYAGNKRCLDCCVNSGTLYLEAGSGTGSGYQSFNTGISIPTGEWSHIALAVDGQAGLTIRVRVYRVSNSTVYDYSATLSNPLWVGDVPFVIGADGGFTAESKFDGKIDEVVVFNDLISDLMIDAIRCGTFPLDPFVQVNAAGANVLYDCKYRAEAAGAMVAYNEGVLQAAGAMVGYLTSPDPGRIDMNGFGVMVGYVQNVTVIHRRFPVPLEQRLLQSQTGKRVFPVVV